MSKNLISDILGTISKNETLRIENRMLIAAKIDDAIKAKRWKKKDLMLAMGKTNQSEVTKWLSGTHNFTIDLLTDLEQVLDIQLLNIQKRPESSKIYIAQVNVPANIPTSFSNELKGEKVQGANIFSENLNSCN